MTISGTTYNKFTVWGINRWGTSVGAFKDSSGKMHGFKRYSDGKGIALDYPGAVETVAVSINDNGTIVGWYSNHLPPNEWRHGFIYSNGNWATLNYSSTLQTSLSGISNTNLIVGNTTHIQQAASNRVRRGSRQPHCFAAWVPGGGNGTV